MCIVETIDEYSSVGLEELCYVLNQKGYKCSKSQLVYKLNQMIKIGVIEKKVKKIHHGGKTKNRVVYTRPVDYKKLNKPLVKKISAIDTHSVLAAYKISVDADANQF